MPKAAGQYPIRVVAKLTGISVDTLRAWERRYGAVTPARDRRGRLYTDADLARLRLLSQAVAAGHGVSRVASLDDRALRRLTTAQPPPPPPAVEHLPINTSALKAALLTFDSTQVDREASRLAAALSPVELVRDALLPALREVGNHWNARRDGIALEHMMSATLRHLFGSFLRFYGRRHDAMRLMFATPPGDHHEIGILAAAMLAAGQGFAVSYLGPNLPASAILAAAGMVKPQVLVLGMTFTSNDTTRRRELRSIGHALPESAELWFGGRHAEAGIDVVKSRGAVLRDFDAYLDNLARLGGRARPLEWSV